MSANQGYRSFADFEREELRPHMRIGWSCDELEESLAEHELDFDADPFEEALWQSADAEEEEEEEDD